MSWHKKIYFKVHNRASIFRKIGIYFEIHFVLPCSPTHSTSFWTCRGFESDLQIFFNHNYCSFHPNLVIWFLVVLGDKATKLLRNSLGFFVSSCLSCLANRRHRTENHATKVTKKPKTKLPKYVLSQAFNSKKKTLFTNN